MNDFDKIVTNFKKSISLNLDEIDLIKSVIKSKSLRKKELLLQKPQICKYQTYVLSGCLRVYTIDESGIEHVNFFAIEDWWAIDLKSFVSQESSRFFIDAVLDSKVLQIGKEDFDMLLQEIPQLEKWFRILLQNALISTENLFNNKQSLKAEERYQKFLQKYPSLESRISQKHIASFLGITPEFLSMLRAKRWKNSNP